MTGYAFPHRCHFLGTAAMNIAAESFQELVPNPGY